MNSILMRGTALVALLVGVAACGGDDGPSGPVAGPLRVVVTSPNTDDGAVMFQVTGVVDSVVVPAGLTLYQSVPGPNVIRAIVTGNISSGSNLLTLYVADVSKASSIATQVLQVAARVTYAQRPAGAYSLTVQK
ncbi:MAG TPA: hypothetical protein PLI70_06075 [Gemmatimonadales bacterium]|nr:hypothetical protein [Gemmatimonadales bacterium]HSA40700.1 hypothetical protein [Mycobacterium sp.]